MWRVFALGLVVVAATPGTTAADVPRSAIAAGSCLEALDDLGVDYETIRRRGLRIGVRIRDRVLGGVEFRGYNTARSLEIDCSLAYSLAMAGRFLRAHAIERVHYSSAYERRTVRGTNRISRHSYGLAIDVHSFVGESGVVTVRDGYEQGLGDDVDCIGEPLTPAGKLLKTIDCQLTRSELFRVVLTPDFDADHYNHFHLEAEPWSRRDDGA